MTHTSSNVRHHCGPAAAHDHGLGVAALTQPRRLNVRAAALVLACSLVTLVGCSESGKKASPADPSRSRSTSSSASPSSSADTEEAAVLTAYTRSWHAQTEAYAKASSAGTALKKYTTLKALADIESDLTAMRTAGQVTTGKPVIHPDDPKVTAGEIPKATLTDCVDTTNWTLIDKASRKKVPLPSTRLAKYVSTATLEKWGKKWMVTELTAQNRSC